MSSEIFNALDLLNKEKGISREYMLEKISQALITAYKRDHLGCPDNIVVIPDMEKRDIRMYLQKTVVEEVEDQASQILQSEAVKYAPSPALGDVVNVEIPGFNFGRIAAQTAKQVIIQGIREAEHGIVFQRFTASEHELIPAVVNRIDERSGNVILEVGVGSEKSEVLLPMSEQARGEGGDHHIHMRKEYHMKAIFSLMVAVEVFDLQIFAMNLNVSTANTDGNHLTPEMKTYYEKDLIEYAEAELIHDQFAEKYPIPKGSGKTIEFRKFAPLPKRNTALTEGTTPDGEKLDVSYIQSTVYQYGSYVAMSDILQLAAIDPIVVQATKLLGSQAGRTLDTVTREVINAGTNVIYAPAGSTPVTSRANVATNSLITLDVIRQAVLQLRRYNAPRFDGSYVCIIHPDVAMDVRALAGWIDVVKYGDPNRIYKGEIGMLEGVRFIENTESKIWEEDTTGSSTTTNVYATNFIGRGAYATTEIEGGGLQMFAKQLGSGGTNDPINQRSTVGWKAIKTAEILIPEYIVRVESSASTESTAIIT